MTMQSNSRQDASGWGIVLLRAVLVTGVGLASSGCAVAQFGSLFGGGKQQDVTGSIAAPTATSGQSLSMASATVVPVAAVGVDSLSSDCPRISVWNDEKQLTIYEPGRVGDSLAIRHRGEITKTARECELAPGQVTVKYGVAGRVLLGPLGQPGTIRLPVVVQVMDKTRQPVKSEKVDIAVEVEGGKPYGNFSLVQRLSFPVAAGAIAGDYQLYVTFDRKAPGAG